MSINTFNRLKKPPAGSYTYILIILAGFGIVYAASLTFVYVEGDDASTILYHVLGRDGTVWPPYAPYQGMMDTLLSLLPANEPLLRIFAISLSAFAGVAFTILTLSLVFTWLESTVSRQWAALGVLLAFPELFFLGLIYNPALIAMAFVVGSHLAARQLPAVRLRQWTRKDWALLLASAFLFGFGTSLRWFVVLYGPVVAADLIFYKKTLRPVDGFGRAGIWGIAALLASLFFIGLSRQWSALMDVFGFSVLVMREQRLSLFSLLGLQTLITPAVALLASIGLIVLLRKRPDLVLIILASIVSVLPVVSSGTPKDLIAGIPALMLCTIQGLQTVLQIRASQSWSGAGVRLGLMVVLLAPWSVGLKVYGPDSLWGPGFEIRKPGGETAQPAAVLFNAKVGNLSFPVTGISIAVNDGMALSTSEGPRPLGAYGRVLLGGGWRAFVLERDREMGDIVQWAILQHRPFLIDTWHSLLFARIIANQYRPADSNSLERTRNVNQVTFENASGEHVRVYYFDDSSALFQAAQLGELAALSGQGRVVLVTESSSILRKCFDLAPRAMDSRSPFAALLDLNIYQESLK